MVPDKTLQIILPTSTCHTLFEEAHGGVFDRHLRDTKTFGELAKHYWWPKMHSDILKWCREYLVCATQRVGKAKKPPLTPIPVAISYLVQSHIVLLVMKSTKVQTLGAMRYYLRVNSA